MKSRRTSRTLGWSDGWQPDSRGSAVLFCQTGILHELSQAKFRLSGKPSWVLTAKRRLLSKGLWPVPQR